MCDLAPIDFGGDIGDGEPRRPRGHGDDDEDPDGVDEPRRLCGRFLRWRKGRETHRPQAYASQRREDRSEAQAEPVRALDEVQHPGRLDVLAHRQFDPELGRPGDDRAEQQLIVQEDDDSHGQHRRADRRPVAGVVGLGDVRSDARQRDRCIADRDRFGGDDEEPAARHRHHRVPDQTRHRERRLELPEFLPAGEAKARGPLHPGRAERCAATGRRKRPCSRPGW